MEKLLLIFLMIGYQLVVKCVGKCQTNDTEESLGQEFSQLFPFLKNESTSNIYQLVTSEGNYTGQIDCSTGFKSGWGKMSWANGTLYGPNNIFLYSKGDIYSGQWKDDKQQGLGTFESRTGIYVGEWTKGLQNGQGKVYYNNGNKYEGQFKDGFKDGYGKFMVTANGDVFTGQFKQGVRHGQGIEKYGATGETYVGSFRNDSRWGLGSAYYPDGSPKFVGPWVKGRPHGVNGTLFLPTGLRLEGQFAQGKPFGNGTVFSKTNQILSQGPWGPQTLATNIQDSTLFDFNLTDNKYANLIKSVADWLGLSLPF